MTLRKGEVRMSNPNPKPPIHAMTRQDDHQEGRYWRAFCLSDRAAKTCARSKRKKSRGESNGGVSIGCENEHIGGRLDCEGPLTTK